MNTFRGRERFCINEQIRLRRRFAMTRYHHSVLLALLAAVFVAACRGSTSAAPFFFSTGNTDGKMAALSKPGETAPFSKVETEVADDFILSSQTRLTDASFTGLLYQASSADISQVRVEIYRVFPSDSNNPPDGKVPTRTNSPADNELLDRDTASDGLQFFTIEPGVAFNAANSVRSGINKTPNQTTGGEGPIGGMEIQFDVHFVTPIELPAGHYFFVPQVGFGENPFGQFLWLSAPKPIVAPGTQFAPDLQAWIRNSSLDPDWLRVGTDIVGGATPPTFNMAFSLTGFDAVTGGGGGVPLPSPLKAMLVTVITLGAGGAVVRRRAGLAT
jgi:hypothetical protein